jgi:hypothetical protein
MKITESQLRQSVRQLLNEEVYGTIATVYHGSRQPPEEFIEVFEDESGKVGWEVSKGAGSAYGHGLYTVWMQTRHQTFTGGYGDWIYKFKVNLYGFIIFDDAVCRKVYGSSITPLEQLERLGKKNFIQRLSNRIKESLSQPPVRDERSSHTAREVSKFLAGAVNGIVFFGGIDGPVVLIYDPNIVTPMAYAELENAQMDIWKKWNPEKIRHSRTRSAQGGTVADPERLQKNNPNDDPERIIKKFKRMISSSSVEQAANLINKLDDKSKKVILQSANLSADLLQKLANDHNFEVRMYIAERNNLSDDLVEKLANDASMYVKLRIARRPNLTDKVLQILAKDTDTNIKLIIMNRSDLSDEVLKILARDKDAIIKKIAKGLIQRRIAKKSK